ncbi:hypothetical protein K2X30_15450 [bacterium]|jgi:hypothetical protein|nr:hypothetical protein [bacterium]
MKQLSKVFFVGILTTFLSTPVFAAETRIEAPAKTITLYFDKGSDTLSASAQKALDQFVAESRPGGISRFVVAAWSDRPFNQTRDLPNSQKDLAGKRLDHINDYLKDNLNSSAKVDKYNMAERTNWLSKTLNTREAELKDTIASGNNQVEFSKQEFLLFKNNGGPSKAVVVVKTEVIAPQSQQ